MKINANCRKRARPAKNGDRKNRWTSVPAWGRTSSGRWGQFTAPDEARALLSSPHFTPMHHRYDLPLMKIRPSRTAGVVWSGPSSKSLVARISNLGPALIT